MMRASESETRHQARAGHEINFFLGIYLLFFFSILVCINTYFSEQGIEPYVGELVAWPMTIAVSSAAKVVLTLFVMDKERSRILGGKWAYRVYAVLLLLTYLYDVFTNLMHLLPLNTSHALVGDGFVITASIILSFSEGFVYLGYIFMRSNWNSMAEQAKKQAPILPVIGKMPDKPLLKEEHH